MPIPILRYSQIADPGAESASFRSHCVYPSNFRIQMRRLKKLGFTGLSLRDLKPYLYGEKSGRVFGITFDCGFRGVHASAMDILQELRFTATSYFVTSQVGGFSTRGSPIEAVRSKCMSKLEILEWALMGHEVGAHSVDYLRLTDISSVEARRQITFARYQLEDMLGSSVDSFSYPYGEVSEEIRAIVEQAGYVSATTFFNGRVQREDDMLWLPRQTVRHTDSWVDVLYKCIFG